MPALFRPEVFEAREDELFGPVVLPQPLSFTAWALASLAIIAAIAALLVFGQYTKRTRVVGITVPASGVLKLTAPQPGIVVERGVEEGDTVRAGQVLFVLSSERVTDGGSGSAGAQSAILAQLDRRRALLMEEQARRSRLLEAQEAAAARRLAELRREAQQLRRELETQSAREASATDQVDRYEELARRNFVSSSTARQRRDDLLDQTARRQALERSLIAVERETGAAAAELRQIPLRAEQQQAELERELASLQQDIVGAEAARRIVVTAPQDGIVTAIAAERGQFVAQQPLATLLPASSPLEAHLFAPSRAIGFVFPGQSVRVRYAAYPFQKFGQYAGEVTHVSRAALAPAELPPQLVPPPAGDTLYRITVRLDSPAVMAYGKPQPLTAGMQLEADILQERRRLIEWIFEPMIAMGRKL